MKTTIEIQDDLLTRSKRLAKREGQPLRALVEDGLRRVLGDQRRGKPYVLPDCSVGDPKAPNPLETL